MPDWQPLSTKFTIEWTYCILIVFKVLSSSPNTPIMKITSFFKILISNSMNWRTWNIGDFRVLNFQYFRNQYFEEINIIFAIIWCVPFPLFNPLQNFIIATPNNKCRVVPCFPDLLFNFLFDIHKKVSC